MSGAQLGEHRRFGGGSAVEDADQEVSRAVALDVPEHLLRGLTDLRIHLGFDRDGREEVQRDAVRVTLVRTRKLQRLRLLRALELKSKE